VGRRVNVRLTVGTKVRSIIGTDVGSTVGVNVGSFVGAVDEATVGVNAEGSFVGFIVGCFDGIKKLEGGIEGNLVGFRVLMLGKLVGSAVGSLVGTKEGIKEEGDDVEGLYVGRTRMGALEVGVLDGFIDTGRFDDGV